MQHVTAQGLADRTRVGVMPIRRHAFWHVADDIDSLRRSKRLAASISRFWAPHRVNQVAIPIDGSIEITPFSLDVDLGFIHIPGSYGGPVRALKVRWHGSGRRTSDSPARVSWFVLW